MKSFIVSLVIVFALLAGLLVVGESSADGYNEPYRPQFHFTPAQNWMNDPNGPVFYKGEYHLFYQYNPFGDEWGHMSWGHAVSPDAVHWRHLPVALAEENGVMIFSGSTVVDWHNTSGFCREQSCLVAIYTGYTEKLQTQNVAYSNDQGRTWTKYAANPVIDLDLKDFRDPKVFWPEPSHKWIMVAALPDQHKVRFFASPDLKHWTALSDFGPAGATGGVWECPDLFELPVEGESGKTRWVLSVNINPGGVAGGSGDQYFIGQFDGTRFTNENPPQQVLWADYGRDFYASASFSDIPASDGRRVWLGWMDNWDYASKLPTHPWRGFQSMPRTLSLRRFPNGLRLIQRPIGGLRNLRSDHVNVEAKSISEANQWLRSKGISGDALEIEAEIDVSGATEAGLIVRKGSHQQTVIGVDKGNRTLFVDRSNSGDSSFANNFAGRQAGPIHLSNEKTVKLHVFVDRSSVELFGNDGETVISDLIFPAPTSQGLEFYSKGGEARVKKLDIWKMKAAR
jgi:fructan beta-fructosidase